LAHVRLTIAVALLFTVFAPMASMQTRGRGVMSGELRGNGGELVAGATVKFMVKSGEPLEATTNKDGKWKIVGIGRGEWTMLVTAPGYSARVIRLLVERENVNGGDPVVTVMRKMTIPTRD
jgi:hypothetical protein